MSEYSDFMDFLDDYTGRGDAKDYIDDRLTAANLQITNANYRLARADADIQREIVNLEAATQDIDIPDFDVEDPEFNKDVFNELTTPEQNAWTPSELNIPEIEIEEFTIDDISAAPDNPDDKLKDISLDYFDGITAPSKEEIIGASPSLDFNFIPEEYVASVVDFLQSNIEAILTEEDDHEKFDFDVDDGLIPLDGFIPDDIEFPMIEDDVIEDIFEKMETRVTIERSKIQEEANAAIQARGFSLPPGVMNATIEQADISYGLMFAEKNMDATRLRFDLEKETSDFTLRVAAQLIEARKAYASVAFQIEDVEFKYQDMRAKTQAIYMDAGVKIEELLSSLHTNKESQRFEAEKENFQAALKVYTLKVEMYKELMQAYMIEAQVGVEIIKGETEYNRSLIEMFSTDMDAWVKLIDAKKLVVEGKKVNTEIGLAELTSFIEKAKAENDRYMANANTFGSEVKAYAAMIDGLKTAETLDLERYSIEAQGKGTEINAMVAKATAELEYAMKAATLSMESLKSQTSISGSIIAASLNAMNTQASFGFSGGARQAHTSSYGKALHVGYSYSGLAEDAEGDPPTI